MIDAEEHDQDDDDRKGDVAQRFRLAPDNAAYHQGRSKASIGSRGTTSSFVDERLDNSIKKHNERMESLKKDMLKSFDDVHDDATEDDSADDQYDQEGSDSDEVSEDTGGNSDEDSDTAETE